MMSSSTATIPSKTSTMNNNDRKRSISSSLRPSPSPPSAKRHGLSSSNSRRTTNKIKRQSERPSRSKQQYRHIDNKSSSSESSRSSSNSINQDYSSATIDIQNSNEILSAKKPHLNSNAKYDTIYTKKTTLIVKPTATIELATNYDNNDEYERTKQILTKSSHVVVPSSVMTIVTTPDLSKKSMMKDNVIIQQLDGTSNKLLKLVVPQSIAVSSSIKMLSSNDGLASALRVPTKIQLTKTSFSSSTKTNPNTSLISSTSTHSINECLSSSNILPDIPMDIIDKQSEQQSTVDYHSSTTLPPTPPPPVIDHTNSNIQTTNNQQEKTKENSSINIKIVEEPDSFPIDDNCNDHIKPKRHTSVLSDWSVPPTSELSPTSLTSSSPDLTQNPLPLDDSLVELDLSINLKQSSKRRHRSLSPFSMSAVRTEEKLLEPMKSKSLTRLSKSSETKLILLQQKRTLTSSPIIHLSSSQRIKKRRRDNENLILNHKSKTKYLKIELSNDLIIQNLLGEIIERIASTNDEKDNTLKTLLVKPVPHVQQRLTFDILSNRQTKSSVKKKLFSSSQSVDSAQLNESRPMVITRTELDELAYLLHANVQRGDYERVDNPAKVEERMRETWSQMSNQKKNGYYKRVIQIYKRPNRDVVITTSPSIIETNFLSSNDLIDNTNLSMNPLSTEFKRQTSTPLSFHSIASSVADESPDIFTDIVNELITGAKGLDKLSCSITSFTDTIHNFVRSSIEKQTEILIDLEQEVEKKCSSQLNRASLFWKQKITYFASKHQINSSNESMNELTLIVKYFYLYVLFLNSRKQEVDFGSALTDLVRGNLTFDNESFCSITLTSIIEDLILPSTLANDYLASQVLIIDQIEYSLPLIRNLDLENELLTKTDACLTTNPFVDFNDLEDYLNRCEHMTPTTTTTIPTYPIQQSHHSSMYYSPYHAPIPPQYYYSPPPQSSDVNNYYYNPSTVYPNSQSPIYPYGQSTSYYHPSTGYNNNNSEQYKYYYNQPQPSYTYSSQSNSTNDIPSLPNNPSIHRAYRPIQRTYSNSQQPPTPTTPVVFDPTATVVAPQSKSMNTNYPP